MIDIRLETGDAAESTRESVIAGLRAFNTGHVGEARREPLILSVRSADGTVVGGLVGETARGWLYVNYLWVDEAHRGVGVGFGLLQMAETEAIARGCQDAYLDTFDFQARPFYERQGYRVFATQENYPPGHQRFYLEKRLVPASQVAEPPSQIGTVTS